MGRAAQHVVLIVGGVLLVGLIVGAVVLTHLDSGSGSLVRPTQVGPAKDVVAPPPTGAVVFAGESGTNAVALAVSPGARPKLTATVLAQRRDPARRAGGRARSCPRRGAHRAAIRPPGCRSPSSWEARLSGPSHVGAAATRSQPGDQRGGGGSVPPGRPL